MPNFSVDPKWYSVNFANENVLQGQQTQFLRFKNLSHTDGIDTPRNIFIMPIIELIGMDESLTEDELEEKYSNQIFFNGADIFKLNNIFKDPNNYTSPEVDGLKVMWYGGPSNHTSPEDFGQYFPDIQTGLNIGINSTQWIGTPIAGPDGPYTAPGEKLNFRIDYKGEIDLSVKITFFLTTSDPTSETFWENFPIIITDATTPKPGDVRKNGSEFQHWDGIDWQSFSGVNLSEPIYGIKHLHQEGYYLPNAIETTEWHDYREIYLFCYKTNDIKPSRNKDYWIDKEIIDKRIYDEKSSYMLMRTNPKLSGNIKLVIDNDSNMYMDTIEANEELSNTKFKRNRVNARGNYISDLKKNYTSLNSEVMFDVFEKDGEYLNSKTEYKDQYDFFYSYGASQLKSKYYDEQFKLFAPLWIKDKLPEFFIIFKAKGPYNPKTYENLSKEEILKDVFSNSEIIKTYDLRSDGNIGTYLGTLVNDERFKKVPLNVNYEKDTLSTWNGIDYRSGIFGEKGEYLYDFFKTDRAIIDFEEFITNGFQRNSLLCPNLINFEFLFNDNSAKDYEINRYFGFFVNEIELAQTEIFPEGFGKIIEQDPNPIPNIDIAPYSRKTFNQTNDEGIILPIHYDQGNAPGEPLFSGNTSGRIPLNEHVQDKNRFFYIQGKDSSLYRIKSIKDYVLGNENSSNKVNYTGLQIYNQKIDVSNFTGIVKLKSQISGEILDAGNSQLVINLQSLDTRDLIFEEGETLEIEYVDINQNLQKWKCNANSTGLQKGDSWNYPVYDYSQFTYENNFNPSGTPEQVAKALVNCLNQFENRVFFAFQNNNEVILKSILDNDAGNGIVFRRNLIKNSVFDNTLFYSIKPERSSILNEDSKSLNISSTGDILSFKVKEPLLRNNFYNIRVINAGTGFVRIRIEINGGLYKEVTVVLDETRKSVIYETDKFEIEFQSVELDNEDNPIEDVNGLYTLSQYTFNDEWEYSYSTQVIEQRFIGGTKRNRSRCKIPTNDAININKLEWFQTQKNKYGRLRNYKVQNQDLIYLYNLEDEILNEGNEIIDFKDLENKSIIQLEDNQEFYRSLDRQIISFENYMPKVGLLSFIPTKDFDFDLIRSDYAYTPSAEIFNYFDQIRILSGQEQILDLGQHYEIKSGEVELHGYNTESETWEPITISEINIWDDNSNVVTFNPDNVKNFNTLLPSYYYDEDKSNSNKLSDNPTNSTGSYFYRVFKALENLKVYNKLKIVANQTAVISKYLYDKDEDLSNFSGFLGISDFISVDDENKLQELIENNDIDRFFFEQLLSEYNRLRENFNKDYAVKSRVVPYINKWVNPGTDCRDNKYRLNNSYAFGLTGFSPDNEISERNPSLHTHEFYYLDEFPENFGNQFLENSRSYFFENISDKNIILDDQEYNWETLFKDVSNDWFMKYFTVGYPNEKNKDDELVPKSSEERYTFMTFIPGVERCQCIFRGAKIEIKDISPRAGGIENISSRKYEDYKFSAILKIKNLQTSTNNKSNDIEFISNEKYKTIVMIITLYIEDYKIQNSGYGYSFLYSANDALRSSSIKNENMLLESNAEYAHWNNGINDIIGGFSTQKHYNSFVGASIIDFSDIKLSGILNTNVANASFPKTLLAISNTGAEFSPQEEISPINGGIYDKRSEYNVTGDNNSINDPGDVNIDSLERGEYSEFSQYIPNYPSENEVFIINNQPGEDQSISILEDRIIIDQNTNLTYSTSSKTNTSVSFPTRRKIGSPSVLFNSNDLSLWYLSGGENYLNKRISEISFANIFNTVNSQKDNVKFTSILSDGTEKTNIFNINFIPFDTILKNNVLGIAEDDDKPDAFKNHNIIGFNINNNDNANETIYRHRGRFEPKSRKVTDFWIREDESMTTHFNKDFLLGNTKFLIENRFFGDISNLYYTKISNGSIIKISDTSNYQPLYPLVNEIAIDFKDFFTFNSNWDNKYYNFHEVRYGNVQQNKFATINDPIEGTEELKESKSFFGSKIMKTPNRFDIDTFNEDEVSFNIITSNETSDISQILQPITLPEEEPTDLIVSPERFNDGKSRLFININVQSILFRTMIENGVLSEFLKIREMGNTRFSSLSDEELEEVCIEYLRKNIVDLYKIDQITLYEKNDAIENNDPIFRIDLSEDQKRERGYKKTKNSDVEKIDSNTYRITQILDTKEYVSYSLFISFVRI